MWKKLKKFLGLCEHEWSKWSKEYKTKESYMGPGDVVQIYRWTKDKKCLKCGKVKRLYIGDYHHF